MNDGVNVFVICLREWMVIILLSSHQMVTTENAEEYVELMFDFSMHTGIQKQMEAFRGTTELSGLEYSQYTLDKWHL